MNYIEIINTSELIGKKFVNSFLVVKNNTPLFQSFELEKTFQYLKDNGLYHDYLLSCEG